jgi:hypothetical protein
MQSGLSMNAFKFYNFWLGLKNFVSVESAQVNYDRHLEWERSSNSVVASLRFPLRSVGLHPNSFGLVKVAPLLNRIASKQQR